MDGKVLVTGTTGFVGGAVAAELVRCGFSVRGSGRKPRPYGLPKEAEYVAADLTSTESFPELFDGVEAVVHVAARAGIWGDYSLYQRDNVEATKRILDASVKRGVRSFVFTSTPSVVYSGQSIRAGDESLPYGAHFPCAYPATKAEAERLVLAADTPGGLRTIALRPHLVWGPGDQHLFPRVFERVRAGKLKIVGDGKNQVDLTYIDNVATGHVAALESLLNGVGGGQAFFLTQDEPVLLWDFVNRVLDGAGLPVLKDRVPFWKAYFAGGVLEKAWNFFGWKSDPPMTRFVAAELAKDHWFSSSSARKILGYQPRVSMEEGLRAYLSYLNQMRE